MVEGKLLMCLSEACHFLRVDGLESLSSHPGLQLLLYGLNTTKVHVCLEHSSMHLCEGKGDSCPSLTERDQFGKEVRTCLVSGKTLAPSSLQNMQLSNPRTPPSAAYTRLTREEQRDKEYIEERYSPHPFSETLKEQLREQGIGIEKLCPQRLQSIIQRLHQLLHYTKSNDRSRQSKGSLCDRLMCMVIDVVLCELRHYMDIPCRHDRIFMTDRDEKEKQFRLQIGQLVSHDLTCSKEMLMPFHFSFEGRQSRLLRRLTQSKDEQKNRSGGKFAGKRPASSVPCFEKHLQPPSKQPKKFAV